MFSQLSLLWLGVLCRQWSRPVHTDIKTRYEGLVAAEKLRLDPQQLQVVKQLQTLQKKLNGYEPSSPSLLQKVRQLCRMERDIC